MNTAAHAYKRPDGFYFSSSSLTTDGVWLASPPYLKLPLDCAPAALGDAVIQVIQASRTTPRVPHPDNWDEFERDCPLLQLAGVPSWNAFEKNAKSCGLQSDGEGIQMSPQRSAGRNQGFVGIPDAEVDVPLAATPEEIGATLARALSASSLFRSCSKDDMARPRRFVLTRRTSGICPSRLNQSAVK